MGRFMSMETKGLSHNPTPSFFMEVARDSMPLTPPTNLFLKTPLKVALLLGIFTLFLSSSSSRLCLFLVFHFCNLGFFLILLFVIPFIVT